MADLNQKCAKIINFFALQRSDILNLRLHSSYAFFIRAYTHVKVEFALHPTYEITKFIKGQHSVLCMI
jgi:hypothetical protein